MKRNLYFIIVATFFVNHGYTTIHHVPDDYQTIMGGVYNSVHGDTVQVSSGTYYENIDFLGKNILLTSDFLFSNDFTIIDNTIINGGQIGSVVTFNSGENNNAQLIGFTLINGLGENTGPDATGGGVTIINGSNPIIQFCRIRENFSIRGAGITIHSSNPIIKNCWIRNNEVTGNFEDNFGGGIFATFSEFTFQNLILSENYSARSGGAIGLRLCEGTMDNILIYGNNADHTAGGIDFSSSSTSVTNATLTDNSAVNNGGAINSWYSDSNPYLSSTIIWDNGFGSINTGAGGVVQLDYSDIQQDWPGDQNINADPQFLEPNFENYFLTEYSPCLNSGDPQNIVSDMGIYVDEDGFFCMGLISGDLNDDSLIDIIDIIILADCIIQLNCPSGNGCEFWHYNVNEDNDINVLDIMGLVISIIGEE